MPRGDYKTVWNALADTLPRACLHVGGSLNEAEVDASAERAVAVLRATTGIKPTDDVLEIGCGIGRVGRALSPIVRSWTGCDVSGNMLGYAARRLGDRPNVKLVEISGCDLAPIGDATMDVVYSTVVFMHLDEWDRYSYVQEAFRVLRPGGRFWCDNVNLCTEDGWKLFEEHRKSWPPAERPPQITKTSTPEELRTYLERAGFQKLRTRTRHLWVDAWGVKPGGRRKWFGRLGS